VAQGLGEYGALASGKGGAGADSSALRDLLDRVQDFVHDATPATWAMIGGGLFLLWFLFLRRRR
jgi:hypothetical protein